MVLYFFNFTVLLGNAFIPAHDLWDKDIRWVLSTAHALVDDLAKNPPQRAWKPVTYQINKFPNVQNSKLIPQEPFMKHLGTLPKHHVLNKLQRNLSLMLSYFV